MRIGLNWIACLAQCIDSITHDASEHTDAFCIFVTIKESKMWFNVCHFVYIALVFIANKKFAGEKCCAEHVLNVSKSVMIGKYQKWTDRDRDRDRIQFILLTYTCKTSANANFYVFCGIFTIKTGCFVQSYLRAVFCCCSRTMFNAGSISNQ